MVIIKIDTDDDIDALSLRKKEREKVFKKTNTNHPQYIFINIDLLIPVQN